MPAPAHRTAPSGSAFDQFREVIGLPVDDALILGIVGDAGKEPIRAAVEAKNARVLVDAMVSHFTRRALLALQGSSLSPDVVRKGLRTVGLNAFLAALRAAEAGEGAALTAALQSGEDPSTNGQAAAPRPRLAPPDDEPAGQQAEPPHQRAQGYRRASQGEAAPSGGTVTQFGPRQPRGPRPAPPGADRPSYRRDSAPGPGVESEVSGHAGNQPRRFQSVHVYNQTRQDNQMVARAAACFELTTRIVDERTGERQPALKIETAGKHPTQPSKYNWDDKIIFYLTEDELPQLLCVFLGLLPSVDYRNHGPQHNKSMKLEHQGKHLYLTMAEGSDRKAAVQLDVGRSTRVATLVARAFQAVNDEIDWAAARDILTRLTAPMAKARAESPQARRT
ncbi:hypothetical protein [Aquimonas voraii]|uniref:Uncharacterized protein n=1 Tax=Aquimonas voraii TaxID=265719 RepID=A0A1G7AAG8_9GAMM|nr:hypothetical protein [Aquimonas voraii]SDE11497.1 hypothetical protein SAMN04488509_12119 [Aquimonas voraii]